MVQEPIAPQAVGCGAAIVFAEIGAKRNPSRRDPSAPCRPSARSQKWMMMSAEPIRAVFLFGGNTEIRIAVERRRIKRTVEAKFGPDLDLRREPMLPADTGLNVAALGAGTLTLHVVVELEAIGDVVERRC